VNRTEKYSNFSSPTDRIIAEKSNSGWKCKNEMEKSDKTAGSSSFIRGDFYGDNTRTLLNYEILTVQEHTNSLNLNSFNDKID